MRHLFVTVVAGLTCLSASAASAQFVQQGPKRVVSGPTVYLLGGSVAISADGNTAIVGDRDDNLTAGALFVFTRTGSAWTEQGPKLVADTDHAGLGGSVAISADGNTAIAACPYDDNYAGSARIFVRTGSTWSQQGPRLAGTGGDAVAISADGNTAIVGDVQDGNSAGALRVFTRSGTTWTQQGPKLAATAGQLLGASLGISADGNTVLAGSLDEAAWVFTRSGSTWTQQGGQLAPADAAELSVDFGHAVALSADGNTAVVGGPYDNDRRGAAWIFTRSGSTWTQQGPKLVGTGAGGDGRAKQGSSLSLSADGNVLLVGGPGDGLVKAPIVDPYDDPGCLALPTGATWVFRRAGTVWSQSGGKLIGTGGVPLMCGEGYQGSAAAISGDGLTAIVTAPFDFDPSLYWQRGAFWIFSAVPNDLRRASDRDGDGRSEITVYNTASGTWSSLTSTSGYTGGTTVGWGGAGFSPVPGDYDGDGKADLGVYEESSGTWYVLLSGALFTTTIVKSAGGPGWLPVPGDYDGDGKTDVVLYNTSTGQWFGLLSGSHYTTTVNISFGGPGYQAVPGDFDGDGRGDIGVYEAATGHWYVLLSSTGYTTSLVSSVGGSGYVPVQADYDGDGKTDFVVYNVDSGLWYGLKSSTGYTTTINVSWGGSGYAPVRGDYDGDGEADLAVYQASSGSWFILLSGSNYTTTLTRNWGGPGYLAVPQYP
jgi:hypothetical protein